MSQIPVETTSVAFGVFWPPVVSSSDVGLTVGGAQSNEVYVTYLIAKRTCWQGACYSVTRQSGIKNEARSWPDAGYTVKRRQRPCD